MSEAISIENQKDTASEVFEKESYKKPNSDGLGKMEDEIGEDYGLRFKIIENWNS